MDVVGRAVYDGEIVARNGTIVSVTPRDGLPEESPYIVPGFVDAHIHIESSMMMPSEFARVALGHGTFGAVCDPHEIANVLGLEGIRLMLDDAKGVPFKFGFMAPSCVPSCGPEVETSGKCLDRDAVAALLGRDDIIGLAEMMNYPGVLAKDGEVMAKIRAAQAAGKPVDGHAPGLRGAQRKAYADAGISTDHECTTLEEGRDAIECGMYVLVREGSAARNFSALSPLIHESPESVMFCSDDIHPGDLVAGHIDRLVRRALSEGHSLMDVLTAACVNPVRHYHLPIGLLQPGDPADFLCISDLTAEFKILETYLDGRRIRIQPGPGFKMQDRYRICNASLVSPEDIAIVDKPGSSAIVASDGSLLTGKEAVCEVDAGLQKLVVYNRYTPGEKPQAAYIRGFGMKRGAIAQTIAHDCHNIVAIGTDDALIVDAVNRLIGLKGGIVVTDGKDTAELPLPVAGLISTLPAEELAAKEAYIEALVRKTGCTMQSPLITLAFMALPVIPELKLTDKGLFAIGG